MSTGKRVLLTGASGFVASHILKALLDSGYWVRCTVRSTSKAKSIEKQYADKAAQLDFAIVEDIAAPNAHDTAVVADPPLDFVIHTASPFHANVQDPERDFLKPAIDGTRGVLQSVQKFAPSVKRVVVTSSFASILDLTKGQWPGTTFTDEDWSPVAYEDGLTNPGLTYLVSKKYTELAALKFIEEQKPNFDLVVMNPPWIFGPVINEQAVGSLNTSTQRISDYLIGGKTEIAPGMDVYVDVRDLAVAHVRSLEVPEAGGQRFLVCANDRFSDQFILDTIHKHFPDVAEKIPVGVPGEVKHEGIHFIGDNSKTTKILGITFRPAEETFADTAKSVLELQKKGTA